MHSVVSLINQNYHSEVKYGRSWISNFMFDFMLNSTLTENIICMQCTVKWVKWKFRIRMNLTCTSFEDIFIFYRVLLFLIASANKICRDIIIGEIELSWKISFLYTLRKHVSLIPSKVSEFSSIFLFKKSWNSENWKQKSSNRSFCYLSITQLLEFKLHLSVCHIGNSVRITIDVNRKMKIDANSYIADTLHNSQKSLYSKK